MLKILNKNFEYINAIKISELLNLRWDRKFYSVDVFSFNCKYDEHIDVGQYVLYNGYIGIIEYIKTTLDGYIQVNGKSALSILNRRITINEDYVDSLARPFKSIILELMYTNLVNPTDNNRKIDVISLSDIVADGDTYECRCKSKPIGDVLTTICKDNKIGQRMVFDYTAKKFIYELYNGKNRSINQTENEWVIFSPEIKNVYGQEYIKDIKLVKNVEYDDKYNLFTKSPYSIEIASGMDRFEFTDDNFVDTIITLNTTVSDNCGYKDLWDLGDIITCKSDKFNFSVDLPIIEVSEIIKNNNFNLSVKFGDLEGFKLN
ncbi:Gp37-like protein [Methanococcus voltae]|uniref:Gp28/Gp37-like domain-containing protein n=1 Tax=Methanococcus voltae (strain ATCC BAA-1334 / A3) TaxID=456320 RepID=D7DSF1_METV3|nr:hypothetical protein [Methanococcus voltae]MCS3901587.1 hypothetical protein [Methanococcus voltae]